MKCQNCGYESKNEFAFCGKCGAKYETPQPEKRVCKQCKRVLTEEEMFCFNCGAAYDDDSENEKQNDTVNNFHSYEPLKENSESMKSTLKQSAALPFNAVSKVTPTAWISGLKLSSYLVFIAAFILGIVEWVTFSNYNQGGFGFLLFLICVIVGFFAVAGIMVFLDMAMDIRKIRKNLDMRKIEL